jgi:multidrug resistance efflux pump
LLKKLSLKWIPILVIPIFCLSLGYWWAFVHPYVWIHSGRINAASIEVKSPEEGILTQLLTQPGSLVEKGALLFSLENPHILEKQKKAKLSLIELQKELQFYKNQSEEAMQNYLSDLGIRSQNEIDQHLQMLQAAQLKLNQIQDQTHSLLEEERQLEQHGAKLSATSPCQGVVLAQQKTVGASIQLGEPIISLLDTTQCWIEATAPEKILHFLELSQPVDIYLTAYPKQSWKGSISWIGPATLSKLEGSPFSQGEETIPIKISIVQENFPKKPGLSAAIRIRR